jgi:hypothetical protein
MVLSIATCTCYNIVSTYLVRESIHHCNLQNAKRPKIWRRIVNGPATRDRDPRFRPAGLDLTSSTVHSTSYPGSYRSGESLGTRLPFTNLLRI